jgi:7-keto-8-aminopelargonate synthetase-like enzyme
MGFAMSLNLDIDSLPPEQAAAAIARLEAIKAQRAAENRLAHYQPYPKQASVRSWRADSYARSQHRSIIVAREKKTDNSPV